jgi:hypothetical protein
MGLKLALLIPDCHIPYQNKKAYNLMIKIAKDLCPDEVVILGDYADFYSVSSHAKDPRVVNILIDEVAEVNKKLDELDEKFPNAKKIYLEGNHENRLERYLVDRAPALFGVTETRFLFDIDKRPNWRFIPYGPRQKHSVLGSYLYAKHTPLANSAKATVTKALCSLVYGHIHSMEENHIVGMEGTNHVAFSVGWLGDKNQDLVFSYVKNHHQWQLGFGLVYVNDKTKCFYHQKIHILESDDKYSCVVNGKYYET